MAPRPGWGPPNGGASKGTWPNFGIPGNSAKEFLAKLGLPENFTAKDLLAKMGLPENSTKEMLAKIGLP